MSTKEYKSDNLGLCPYLEMNGLKYLRAEVGIGKNDKSVVLFVFEDRLGVGRDLERDFIRSNEKKYRDLLFFFRNEIEKLKAEIDHLNRQRHRRNDEKYNGEE